MHDPELSVFISLGVSLAIGLLIGIERGWHHRKAPEGERVAGIRTFSILGLTGGFVALLADRYGAVVLGLGMVAVAIVLIVAYRASSGKTASFGVTSEIAALATFALGAAATAGYVEAAAAGAVVVATALGLKTELHGWVERLDRTELIAGLQLALISVVVLPLLPNRGLGPWGAINPYRLWWLVVLIAAIAFVGHFAIRIAGRKRGILLTGFFGGLASSTALTLSFARMGARQRALQKLLAAGIVVAAGTTFPRMLMEVWIVDPALVASVAWGLGAMTAVAYLCALVVWLIVHRHPAPAAAEPGPPFQFRTAMGFGLLLAFISLLSEAARHYFGSSGIYVLAAISGLGNVDAITLSLARMAGAGLEDRVAVNGILLAGITNTLVKAGLVAALCRGVMAIWVGGISLAVAAAGTLVIAVA